MRALYHGKSGLHQCAGVTLIELMIAIFISTIILAATISVITIYQKNAKTTSALISNTNKINRIKHIFQAEVDAAGFIGCHALTKDFYLHHPYFNVMLNNRLIGNSDYLEVKYASPQTNSILSISPDGLILMTSAKHNIIASSWVLISDCRHVELAYIEKVYRYQDHQKIILSQPLTYHYQPYAELSRLEYHRFFIDKTKYGYKALYVTDLAGQKTELVSDIEGIQFKFIKRDQDGVQIKTAVAIEDWSAVIGVNIRLILSGKNIDIGVVK